MFERDFVGRLGIWWLLVVAAPCSCRLLTHSSLLWHHHLGHPSLKRLRCMHSRLLVSSLLRSLPPPLPSLAPPLTLHSSFPLHTLHMEVWDPTPVSRSRWGHYFLLIVDDFTRYTTVFPLEHKGDVWVVLICWIRAVCCQLSARFRQDLPVLRLHSDHGGKFSFGLLEDFCREEDITQSFQSQQPSQPLELVDVDSSAVGGGDAGGAGSGGAGPGGGESGGAGYGGAGSGVADSGVAERPSGGGVEGTTAGGSVGSGGDGAGSTGAEDAGGTRAGVAGGAGAGGAGGSSAGGAGGSGARCTGARGARGSGARGSGGLEVFELKVPTLEVQPHHVALPLPPSSSLSDIPDPVSDLARAASPSVTRCLATLVTEPIFLSGAAIALVTELVDFAATCPLDYHASLVFDCAYPPSIGGELALGCDVLEDGQFELECLTAAVPHLAAMLLASEGDPDALGIPTPRSYAEAITGQYSSHWQTAMDVEMTSWNSTGTYVDTVPPLVANRVDCMCIFKAYYIARGFCQRQGTILWVLLHILAHCDYELYSLDFSTNFLQGSLHEEIWLRRPPGFSTDSTLPPVCILVYIDDSVFVTADTEALALMQTEL
ncbi:unnamed protein product [Closterium sp. NIES-54]